MKRLTVYAVLLAFLILLPVSAYGHAGHTDSNGGHFDYDSGEYHYHHGYPAHSHRNGTCPYDYDDRTGEDSGSNNGYSSYGGYTSAPRPYTSPTIRPTVDTSMRPKEKSFIQKHPVWTTFIVIAAILSVVYYVSSKREKAREQERLAQVEEEKKKTTEFYSTHDLRTLCHIPEIYYIDQNNVPYEYNKPKEYTYGVTIDVYISHGSSNVYHTKDCRYAAYRYPMNVFSAGRSYYLWDRRPCSVCKPSPLPDTGWYREFVRHIAECERYGISPRIDPDDYVPPTHEESRSVQTIQTRSNDLM